MMNTYCVMKSVYPNCSVNNSLQILNDILQIFCISYSCFILYNTKTISYIVYRVSCVLQYVIMKAVLNKIILPHADYFCRSRYISIVLCNQILFLALWYFLKQLSDRDFLKTGIYTVCIKKVDSQVKLIKMNTS